VAFRDEYDAARLENASEDEVFDAIDRFLANDDTFCRCQHCVLDLAALALSSMPPAYRVGGYTPNPPGALSVMWDETVTDLGALADNAVAAAAERVRQHPHH